MLFKEHMNLEVLYLIFCFENDRFTKNLWSFLTIYLSAEQIQTGVLPSFLEEFIIL